MAGASLLIAKHPYAAQVVCVAILAAGFTYVTAIVLPFRSLWNAVWMIVLPIAVGFAFNREAGRKCLMAMALTAVSLLSTMATENALGGY